MPMVADGAHCALPAGRPQDVGRHDRGVRFPRLKGRGLAEGRLLIAALCAIALLACSRQPQAVAPPVTPESPPTEAPSPREPKDEARLEESFAAIGESVALPAAPPSRASDPRADIEIEGLGTARWDARVGLYVVSVTLPGRPPVRLSIGPDQNGGVDNASNVAKELVGRWHQHASSAKRYAAEQLLRLKNETWLQPGQKPVSRDAFMRALRLDAIDVFSEGSAVLYFDDGDMFWGHTIMVDRDDSGRFESAELAG